MGLLEGKVIVVTGAGGGLGREHALAELRHVVEKWGDAGGEVLTITDTNGVRVYLAELADTNGETLTDGHDRSGDVLQLLHTAHALDQVLLTAVHNNPGRRVFIRFTKDFGDLRRPNVVRLQL